MHPSKPPIASSPLRVKERDAARRSGGKMELGSRRTSLVDTRHIRMNPVSLCVVVVVVVVAMVVMMMVAWKERCDGSHQQVIIDDAMR